MRIASILFAGAAALGATAAEAQTPTITLYELPAFLGRSVTVTADTPDLAAQSFAARARSARVTGSWQVCPSAKYAGTCRTLTADQPLLQKSAAVSLRPTPGSTTSSTTGSPASNTSTAVAVDLDSLDAAGGTEGQDVTFFATPTLSGTQVSAGSNDVTSAAAFCKLAGATSASAAGRARAQSSGLIDVAGRTKVRGYALRDVVCRK